MTLILYPLAALAEIAGCFAFWAWLKLDRSPLWLFAYGSLIWKPEIEHLDERVLDGEAENFFSFFTQELRHRLHDAARASPRHTLDCDNAITRSEHQGSGILLAGVERDPVVEGGHGLDLCACLIAFEDM